MHGRDGTWKVLKHNFTKLIACDIQSRGFVWFSMAWITAIAIELVSVWQKYELNMWVELGLGAHVFLAALHWAARDQFKLVIEIARDRWGKKP